MRAIDTNVLVRLLTRDDAEQTDRAEAFVAKGAWLSQLVLVESVWVLESVYALDRGRIEMAVAMLLEHAQLVVQDPDVVRAALDLYREIGRSTGRSSGRSGGGVEFSDCLILESARKAGHVPLGTFDRVFARLDGAEGL